MKYLAQIITCLFIAASAFGEYGNEHGTYSGTTATNETGEEVEVEEIYYAPTTLTNGCDQTTGLVYFYCPKDVREGFWNNSKGLCYRRKPSSGPVRGVNSCLACKRAIC